MSNEFVYKSPIAHHIMGFIEEKIALGYKYITETRIMKRFDKYWYEHGYGEVGLTKENLSDWILKSDNESAAQLRNRVVVIRQFSKYLNSMSIHSYIPPLKIHCEKPIRHILSKQEIEALFSEIDCHSLSGKGCTPFSKRMVDSYPILFRLLYLNGMRISEVCSLQVSEINLNNGTITILNGKGNTDRLIYIANDMNELCKSYINHLHKTLGEKPKWLFPGRNAENHISISAVEREFNRFWSRTIFAKNCNKKPTVHDLRHTYVVHRINYWLEQGLDFEHMLPYLSNFLGHNGFDSTFYYYHYVDDAARTIQRMDTITEKVIPEVMRR